MRRIWKLLVFSFLCMTISQTVRAEEIISQKEALNIIFVIDSSGSMKTNDSSRVGLDMVRAFIDTVRTEEIRVGYVAYNDGIVSYAAPEYIGTTKKREELKTEIGSVTYSGNTDIGMGVSYAYELLSAVKDGRRMMVLISDGETDLPKTSDRTEEQSNQELAQCVDRCREDNIQIYTVAFGEYDGSEAFLREISTKTGAESYSAQSPENLVEVLYGIFQDNLLYQIQRFSSGTYAGGEQDITCILDSSYLDEINILLLSSETVGETVVKYGNTEISLTDLSHYAVGKIRNGEIDASAKELVVHTVTEEGQDLQIYAVSYRGLTPVLEISPTIGRNRELQYQVYFKDRNGKIVSDSSFYEAFSWNLFCPDSDVLREKVEIGESQTINGVLQGNLCFTRSGTYTLNGILSDDFGSYSFAVSIEVSNTTPSGSIPEESCTLLERDRTICLDDYFTDEDGDVLSYSITNDQEEGVDVRLEGNLLTLAPQSTGIHVVILQVSDGEETIQYVYRLEVLPLWQVYWWVIALALAGAAFVLWKLTHKPKLELERLTEEKKKNNFYGKLDAYFVRQPEDEEEIPPLSIQMNRIKDSKISLGDLFETYPIQAEALQLNDIHLIADEKRNMILYHTSKSAVMVGSSIACRQLQYSIGFGDVIYVTSPDGCYDLEIHYIAVFQ